MEEQHIETESEATLPKIGDYLKLKREEKGYTLKIISQHTRINASLLEKLERNRLEELPSKAYVTGFVKSYAKTLGLNESDALEILEQTYATCKVLPQKPSTLNHTINRHETPQPLGHESSQSSSKMLLPIFVIGAALLLVLVAIFSSGGNKQPQEQKVAKEAEQLKKSEEKTITPKSVSATTPLVTEVKPEDKKSQEAEKEAKAQEEAEAKRLAEEAKAKKEAEAKRLAEEAKAKKEAEAKRLAEEVKAKKEAEAKRLAEEAKAKKEAETKRLAEEAKAKKEAEAKRLAEEAKAKKEAEAKRLAEEAKAKKEAEAKRLAEEAKAKKEADIKTKKINDKKIKEIEFKKIPLPMFSYVNDADSKDLEKWLPNKYKHAVIQGKENIYIHAIDGDTWLTYKSDEQPIKKFILRQDRSVLIRGNDVRIFLGNAKVAKIFYNNKLIEPQTKTGVKSLVFPIENAENLRIPLFLYNDDGTVSTTDDYINSSN